MSYVDLKDTQKRMVHQREAQLVKWRNSHPLGAVYSAACTGDVDVAFGVEPAACAKCEALYSLHSFRVALNRPPPDEENMKFVPHSHRSTELGKLYLQHKGLRRLVEEEDGQSPWLKFARGAVDGVYEKCGIVLGMVEALVKKSERIRLGKTLRGMKYTGAFNDFCNIIASVSPRAYRTFRQHFGGRGMRSIRYVYVRS